MLAPLSPFRGNLWQLLFFVRTLDACVLEIVQTADGGSVTVFYHLAEEIIGFG
jgi:hypothetical protein